MKNDNPLKEKVINGMVWKFSEKIGVQLMQFVIQVVLARLLTPGDFGTIAIITVFIMIANVLVQYGFTMALVQRKDVNALDYSTVFYINLLISTVMYILLFVFAPSVSRIYSDPHLVLLLRVQSLMLFGGAISGVQNAYISRKMNFKKSFIVNFLAVAGQGICGIVLAVLNYGIWSLVVSQLLNSILLVVFGFLFIDWRPIIGFSVNSIKSMFGFGKNLLLASLIQTIFTNIYSLTIGKFYNTETLGYYNRGYSIPSMLITTIDGSIQGVLFPALSICQDNKKKLVAMMRKSIRMSSYLICPIMFGIVAVAPNLISVLLTDKWLPAVPFLRLSCIALAIYPIHTANLQAISAVGKSDIYLKLEIIKKILMVTILVITLPIGIEYVMWGNVACSLISTVINAYPNKKLFDYALIKQLKDLVPSFLLSSSMGIIVYFIGLLPAHSTIIRLIVQIIIGIVVYIVGSIIINIPEFSDAKDIIRNVLSKRL